MILPANCKLGKGGRRRWRTEYKGNLTREDNE
jgi:hypothetical protein